MKSFANITPVLSINPATTLGIDPEINFKRAGTLKYINKEGLLATANEDSPAFEWDYAKKECIGLAIPNQNNNYLLNSEDFTASTWSSSNLTLEQEQVINPEGAVGATKVSASVGGAILSNSVATGAISISNQRVCSITAFVKKGQARYIRLYGTLNPKVYDEVPPDAWFDMETETIVYSRTRYASIDKLANGWYRISTGSYHRIEEGVSTAFNNMIVKIYGADEYNAASRVGEWFTLWAMQYNRGSANTGWYIRTANSAAVTPQTLCYYDLNKRVRSDRFTFMIDWLGTKPNQSNGFIACLNCPQTESNYVGIAYQTGYSMNAGMYLVNSNSEIATETTSILNINPYIIRQPQRIGMTFEVGKRSFFSMATTGTYATNNVQTAAFSEFKTLSFGARINMGLGTAFTSNGWLRECRVYSQSMTLSELRALTQNPR